MTSTRNNPPVAFEMLAEISGQAAELFTAPREPASGWWGSFWTARRNYHFAGLPLRSAAGDGGAEQKRRSRALASLRSDGFIRIRTGLTKSLSAILTPRGFWYFRDCIGLWSLDEAIQSVARLHDLREHPDAEAAEHSGAAGSASPDRPWISERTVADDGRRPDEWTENNSDAGLRETTNAMVGPQFAGWVEANCSNGDRHVRYRLTESGRRLATGAEMPPTRDAKAPRLTTAKSDALADIFIAAVKADRGRIRSATDCTSEIGIPALPAAMCTRRAAAEVADILARRPIYEAPRVADAAG